MLLSPVRSYINTFSGLSRPIWLLSLVLLVNRSGAMVIPFLTIYLTTQRGFSLYEAGLVMSCYGLGSILGSYVGGWLTDRIGFHRIQFWTLIGSGFLFMIVGQLDDMLYMCAGIFVLSTVADAFRPANQAAVAYYTEPKNLARAFGLIRLAVNLGFSIGPVMGGLIAAGLGYRWLFIVNGATCIAAGIVFLLTVKNAQQVEGVSTSAGRPLPGRSAYRDKPFLLFNFFMMLGMTAFMQFFNSLPIYLQREIGMLESEIGRIIALNGLLIVVLEMPLVHWISSRARPLRIIGLGVLFIGSAYLLLPLFGGLTTVLLLFVILLTIGEIFSMPFGSTFSAARASQNRQGQYQGLYSISFSMAFIVAPTLGLRWAESFGFNSLWWLIGGLGLVSALGMFGIQWYLQRGETRATPAPAPTDVPLKMAAEVEECRN